MSSTTRAHASVRGVVRGIGGDPRVAEQRAEAARCGRVGQPRLLLVASDAEAPADWDALTDWVRLPVDDRDLCARVAALQRLASQAPAPALDEFDVLWRGDRWVPLAPIEARIVARLLARCGSVVSRRDLVAAAWIDGMPGARAVDGAIAAAPRPGGAAGPPDPQRAAPRVDAGGGRAQRVTAVAESRALEVEEPVSELLDLGARTSPRLPAPARGRASRTRP